jgi:hypothetical protein
MLLLQASFPSLVFELDLDIQQTNGGEVITGATWQEAVLSTVARTLCPPNA